jgi:hypothetical protein
MGSSLKPQVNPGNKRKQGPERQSTGALRPTYRSSGGAEMGGSGGPVLAGVIPPPHYGAAPKAKQGGGSVLSEAAGGTCVGRF